MSVGLPTWPPMPRSCFWRLLDELGGQFEIVLAGTDEVYTEPFRAALAAMVGADNLRRCSAGRRAAIEAASVFHSDDPESAAGLIASRLRTLKVSGHTKAQIAKEIRKASSIADSNDPTAAAHRFLKTLEPPRPFGQVSDELNPCPYLRYLPLRVL